MEDIYEIGKCYICKKLTALKNGFCVDCNTNDKKIMNKLFDLFKDKNDN